MPLHLLGWCPITRVLLSALVSFSKEGKLRNYLYNLAESVPINSVIEGACVPGQGNVTWGLALS
jgi:hypothetical protein